jgi:glucose-1-phosphate thymidylyltransferase
MKAVIPVAGAGTTLRPHTHTHPKPLIPVAGKPILAHIVDSLLAAGVQDFVFVVGYLGEKIRQFVQGYGEAHGFRYTFVEQEPRLGLAHAIHLCRNVLAADEPLIIALGDTIVDTDVRKMLVQPKSVLCVQKVDQPWLFGIAVPDDQGERIVSLVEKPRIPKSNLALVGLYKIQRAAELLLAIQTLIDRNQRTRGEFQLTDALQIMLENGVEMHTQLVNKWYDCGKKDVLLDTNRMLLDRMELETLPDFPGSIVRPPVYLAEGVVIRDSIVGPYVAVAENAIIEQSIVENSILGAYSRLDSIILKNSVVGNDTSLTGRWHSINIGDNTEIDFNA